MEETTAACAERKGGHDAYGYDDVNRHDDDGEMTMMMLTMETIAVTMFIKMASSILVMFCMFCTSSLSDAHRFEHVHHCRMPHVSQCYCSLIIHRLSINCDNDDVDVLSKKYQK